jgi:hypothetical protein
MKKIICISFVVLSACSKNNLPEFNKLEGLRLLAFQTITPEVNPGAAVTLTPIISDVNATGMMYSAASCVDTGISYGATATCEGNPTKVVIATNVALTLPGTAESWTGLANSFVVNVPNDTLMFTGRTAQETFNGVNYIVEYTLTNNKGESLTSIKRIPVSETTKTVKNTNPTTSDILADGASMTALSFGAKTFLSTDVSLSSAEVYTTKNAQLEFVTQTEKLTTTWFVTDGTTKYYRSSGVNANEFTAPDQAPSGRSFYLLAVTRDERGGLSVVKKKF